jgi:hypothetical protein
MRVSPSEIEQLSLLFRLLILHVSLASLAFSTLVLDILIVDGQGFINLCLKSRVVLDAALH